MAQSNVVELFKYKNTDNDVLNQINDFLNIQTENTQRTYKMGIESFYNKKISEMTVNDIENTKLSTFKKFIFSVKEELNTKSIKNKITAVKELLRYIQANYDDNPDPIQVDTSYFNSITKLMKNFKKQDNFYGRLSVQEVWDMAEWARVKEREMRDIKYLLILFSLDTCARKGECLKLKWSFFENVDELGEVQINIIGKGNKDFYPKIKKWFYDELVNNLKNKYNSEYVFPISISAVDSMMNRYRKDFEIPDERNIVFHSIRGTGITFKYHMAGNDIEAARKAANHSKYDTLTHYMSKEDRHADGAVSLSKTVDNDLYKSVTREQLIKVIEGMSKDKQMEVNIKLKKLINENANL
jgi:integrase/recombinase XerD